MRYDRHDLTKEMLQKQFGITDVTKDGKIYTEKGELSQHLVPSSKTKFYIGVTVYNKLNKVKIIRKINHYNTDGTISTTLGYNIKPTTLGVHRIIYIWFNETHIQEKNFVIDHIDNNPYNNSYNNLQKITQAENLAKNRLPGKYNHPLAKNGYTLEYIDNKIKLFTEENEEAKHNHDAKRCHSLRGSIARWKNIRKQIKGE